MLKESGKLMQVKKYQEHEYRELILYLLPFIRAYKGKTFGSNIVDNQWKKIEIKLEELGFNL